jgi:5-methyltetrahydropteroyltriglutamate--homocysteine methyltransferase
MTSTHILGFPRIGAHRELKSALESFWRGDLAMEELQRRGAELRQRHWKLQADGGLDYVTVGDFAWYDHVHTTTCLLGAVPSRFSEDGKGTLAIYFDMARGNASQPAFALKKWFDTNYHYLVPELSADTRLSLDSRWLIPEVEEARALGHRVKVVLTGPFTWLSLASSEPGFDRLTLLPALVEQYVALCSELIKRGVEWLQLDEPLLAQDVPPEWLACISPAYEQISGAGLPIMLATYFGSVAPHAGLLKRLRVAGLHLDLVRARDQLDAFLDGWPAGKVLSLGVVDGRNIWRADLERTLAILRRPHIVLGDRLWISASCSLLHVPIDLELETGLSRELRHWLAFAKQKIREIALLKSALDEGEEALRLPLEAASAAAISRRRAAQACRQDVRDIVASLSDSDTKRAEPLALRAERQRKVLGLPLLPTTTIGSFPQTGEIRATRNAYKQRRIDFDAYTTAMFAAIEDAIRRQEELGLDVLVHGEPERNDMVEYFGEHLDGCAITEHGWVQSYGSRCVKPPIIFGDISRRQPITLGWVSYARTLTRKPVKGMLTGPVTLLAWSFVRDDLPRREVALQLALALREEVMELEESGVRIIQIDEPALREGLPLKKMEWGAYLDWATAAFRAVSAKVRPSTQIHTHMCYSQFEDILPAIAAMDADVVTVETARSPGAFLDALSGFEWDSAVGPGVYDIHSPRVPEEAEMRALILRLLDVVPPHRLWINPDCGLKTRTWEQAQAALRRMVFVTHQVRSEVLAAVS